MTTKPPSKQKLLYQQAWLRAHRDDQGLQLHFKSKAGAYEARRHLYEAVREAKEKPMDYPDLARAAEGIQIVWAGEASLHMRHRDQNDATQGLEAALGLSLEAMVDPKAAESAAKLLKQLEAENQAEPVDRPGEHQDTPFYSKRS